jgi:hypothetical protein
LSFMSDNDAERRSRLLSLKLSALVSQHRGVDASTLTAQSCGLGSAVVSDDEVWILVEGDALRSLGPALAWSSKYARPLHLVVDNHAEVLARRASGFTLPVSVWQVEDTRLLPAVLQPHQQKVIAPTSHVEFISLIAQAGAEPLEEWGVVTGEVRGLEICRVVDDPQSGVARLEVGIGAHDRETFALVHQDRPLEESIASVVEVVGAHRVDGAPFHPYNHIAPERFARWKAMQEPSKLGFPSLVAVDPPEMRTNVKDSVPCIAIGVDDSGNTTAIAFVHGIDLDVVPFALDAAVKHSCARVMIVARPQDVVAPLRVMAEATTIPTTFTLMSE